MKKQKARIDFSRVPDNDLTELAQLIYNKMFGNPDFPNPTPTLIVFQTSITDYSDALIKAKDGTKQDTAEKNSKRKALEENLSILGDYVNDTAKGDVVKLEGSGFPLTKVPEPVGILPPPESFDVTVCKNPGDVKIKISVVKRASGYIVLFAKVPPPVNDAEWQSKTFSMSRGLITGLESGKKYVLKAAAASREANKIGLYNFTEPVEVIVQ